MKIVQVGAKIVLPNGEDAPFSKAVRCGDFLFLSGVLSFDKKGLISESTIEGQTRVCY